MERKLPNTTEARGKGGRGLPTPECGGRDAFRSGSTHDWSSTSLDEVAVKIQDGTHFSPKSIRGPRRYLTSKNVRFGRLDLADCGWISESEHRDIFRRCDVQPGDVLLTKDGANTGNAAVNTLHEEFSLLSSVALIRCRPAQLNNRYLLQYLLSSMGQQRLKELMTGNAISRLTLQKIKAFTIPRPSVEQQAAIAAVLDTVDESIAATEAVIAKLKQVRAGLLHDLLTRGLDEHGQLRDPRAHPEQFKESPLGRIPREWDVTTVGDIVARDRQGILTGPFGVQLGTNDFVPQGVPVLQVGNVQAGYVDLAGVKFVTDSKAAQLSRYRIQPGDLLFARSGATTGRNALADACVAGAIINYHIIRVAVAPCRCDPRFLFACFNSDSLRRQVHSEKGKGTRESVNTASLSSFQVPLPSLREQTQSTNALESLDDMIACETAQQEKLRAVKSGLTSDLLTGRVRVPENIVQEVP